MSYYRLIMHGNSNIKFGTSCSLNTKIGALLPTVNQSHISANKMHMSNISTPYSHLEAQIINAI